MILLSSSILFLMLSWIIFLNQKWFKWSFINILRSVDLGRQINLSNFENIQFSWEDYLLWKFGSNECFEGCWKHIWENFRSGCTLSTRRCRWPKRPNIALSPIFPPRLWQFRWICHIYRNGFCLKPYSRSGKRAVIVKIFVCFFSSAFADFLPVLTTRLPGWLNFCYYRGLQQILCSVQ